MAFAAGLVVAGVVVVGGAPAGAGAAPRPTWSTLSPPTQPPPLQGAAAAYDPADGTVVVFGGRLADGQLSDATWIWNGSTWSASEPVGATPPARALASMAFDAGLDPPQLILFGGRAANGTLLDDTWTWNGASWYQVDPATTPGGRQGAALAPDADGHLVLFGGYGTSNATAAPPTPPTTTTTTRRSTTTTTTTTPTTAPTSPPTTGSVPTTTGTTTPSAAAARASATAKAAGAAATKTTTTTTPGRDPSTPTTGPDGTATPVRAGLRTSQATPSVLADTWILVPGAGGDEWQSVDTRVAPPPVTDAVMARGSGDQTVLFGGTSEPPGNDQQQATSDRTWIWNGHDWVAARTKVAPPARQDATMAYDSDLGRTVLVGGVGAGGALGDTWAWNGSSWSRDDAASPPTPRSGAAGAYDTASRQFLLFGGADASGAAIAATEVLSSYTPTDVTTGPSTGGATTPSSGSATTAPAGRGRTTTTTGSRTSGGGGPAGGGSTSGAGGSAGKEPLTATSISLHRGDVVTLTGSGFMPHTRITITFHSVAMTVGRTTTDAAGAFRVDVAVPTQAAIGEHHFVAVGLGPSGETTLVTPVQVVGLTVAHHASKVVKITMVAIAVAIPAATWAVLGGLGRRRRATAA